VEFLAIAGPITSILLALIFVAWRLGPDRLKRPHQSLGHHDIWWHNGILPLLIF
jgi:hypothetical protein